MNPFIDLEEYKYKCPDTYMLIYCVPGLKLPSEHIPNSVLYSLEEDGEQFIKQARSIEIDDDKTLICYDLGDHQYASKAYWGFRASGFEDVRVLLGGIKTWKENHLEMAEGCPSFITKSIYPYLPFNSSVVLTKFDFSRRDSWYQQIISMDETLFEIINENGQLQNQSQISKFLIDKGVLFVIHKPTITHGKFGSLLGLLLVYLGAKTVSVAVDDINALIPTLQTKKTRSVNSGSLSSSIRGAPRSFTSEQNNHYSMNLPNSNKKIEPGRSANICAGCLIM
ncbi:unnamed protein product [Blepharisma stoltei]|uniref:Rhodanese domain-containing protein n=1 Tax=Blepharisma stoltei TaxID=1481888 RepID=A0AAU9JGQ2_9CILI|nr:unnamed protein product [Blepharisma stoltei]